MNESPVAPIEDFITQELAEDGIALRRLDEREFPDERWLIAYVDAPNLATALSRSGGIEQALSEKYPLDSAGWVVAFRPQPMSEAGEVQASPRKGGRLNDGKIDQLIQLLAARSRTSDALPSLDYVEDPRASLPAISASRHHIVYGRRGVGKTALLLEAKRSAEAAGSVASWSNAHTLKGLSPEAGFCAVMELALRSIASSAGTSKAAVFARLVAHREELAEIRTGGSGAAERIARILPDLNRDLRWVLRGDMTRLFVFVDDFYLYPIEHQAALLDYVASALRDCDGWLKITSIEKLTRPYEPSSRIGLEAPHDVTVVDLDITLEDPRAAQDFLESIVRPYVSLSGLSSLSSFAKPEALGRLVLASGGVPRDYMNLLSASIVDARSSRPSAREIGREDVARAAGAASRTKKRDLDQDVRQERAFELIEFLDSLSTRVKSASFTYFLVDYNQKDLAQYEQLMQLVDLRFAHVVHASLSDQHRSGVRYEAFMLDLSEFSDVRLQRGLNVLDLVSGKWAWRLTGQNRTIESLTATQFRDKLRKGPTVNLADLQSGMLGSESSGQ